MLDEEVALGNDSRYRNFIVNIEKALKQFESWNEWPDLIAYLARLKKVRIHSKKEPLIGNFLFKDYRKQCTISFYTKTHHSIQTFSRMSSSSITIRCSFKNS